MELGFRRLYWRIALYIGIALAAFVLLGVVSVGLVASSQLANYAATRQSPLGREAAAVLSAEGRPGLENWLRSAAVPRGVIILVLDSESRDILGRQVPREYASFVRQSVVGPAEIPARNYRPVRLAPQLIGPDGEAYAFLVLPNEIKLWGSAATAIGLALVALLVIASVAWLIARAVGRPVAGLQLAVRELARGRIDTRVPDSLAGRRDELGALAADFNSMAAQLQELLEGRERLMAELSHELRSPLARLQAATALAAQRPGAKPAEAARVEQEIRRMDQVIGDLLRYSRLGATGTVSRRLVRIEVLLAELAADEEIEARARGCDIELRTAQDLLVVGDPELLRSAFENILRNAIRYAPGGSRVRVDAVRAGDEVQVTIADRGPGVPVAILSQIFEPYFRAPGTAGGTGGTGLGLAIARRVFEAHGGSVQASLRDGGGLRMDARLPAAASG
ncbi:MAG: HAMP domain-containing protein [Chromatiales bacterium]|nr:HAMP domain-containing protein [Chromatiales bacterium]